MKRRVAFYASVSFGKDSLATLLLLLEKKMPLDEVIFYNSEMEFDCIYHIRDRIKPVLEQRGIRFTEVKPGVPFLYNMLDRPVDSKKPVLQPQEAPVRPAPPQQEVSQRSPDQGRQQAPVTQRQVKEKNGSRSERDSHVIKISSSIPKESGTTRGTSERPSIAARLEAHRAQVRRPSAPARERAKSVAKNRPKTR